MDPEIKTEWIKRLKSGDYVQGQERLKRTMEFKGQPECSYCCLGVLCDILQDKGLGEWNGDEFALDREIFKSNYDYETDYTLEGELSSAALVFVGMNNHEQQALISMNDSEGKDFDAIAEVIQAEL